MRAVGQVATKFTYYRYAETLQHYMRAYDTHVRPAVEKVEACLFSAGEREARKAHIRGCRAEPVPAKEGQVVFYTARSQRVTCRPRCGSEAFIAYWQIVTASNPFWDKITAAKQACKSADDVVMHLHKLLTQDDYGVEASIADALKTAVERVRLSMPA